MTAPAPLRGDVAELLADVEGELDCALGVVGLDHRIVEEDHDPVAREVLERAVVGDNECTKRRVVQPQEPEHLLGLGGLREDGEVAEVAEQRGDLATMAGEHRLPIRARDERGDLRRQEAGKLRALAVDRPEEGALLVTQPLLAERVGRCNGIVAVSVVLRQRAGFEEYVPRLHSVRRAPDELRLQRGALLGAADPLAAAEAGLRAGALPRPERPAAARDRGGGDAAHPPGSAPGCAP